MRVLQICSKKGALITIMGKTSKISEKIYILIISNIIVFNYHRPQALEAEVSDTTSESYVTDT
jgi:hypothetical protein